MFFAKQVIGGLINVVNIDQFVPSDPPPPRRPVAYAEQHESDEERQFRKVFQQLAGEDMEVSPNELMNILNRIISKDGDLKTDGFSIENCRSMVAVMDQSDSTGKLGFHEFKLLWNNIKKWQAVYKSCDRDRSGYIGADELPGAFTAAFPLDQNLFNMIIRRYSDENGNMDFDNYIGCLVRLDAMCAFKTLDKDNNGSIKVNVQEVSISFNILLEKDQRRFLFLMLCFMSLQWLQLTMYS
uniref:EF-hand domain-containing protein n=1 Tax=Periophthalmus magnuspinnatus TaxID=409849 RepID=A0A3B3ZSG3_9GOBI